MCIHVWNNGRYQSFISNGNFRFPTTTIYYIPEKRQERINAYNFGVYIYSICSMYPYIITVIIITIKEFLLLSGDRACSRLCVSAKTIYRVLFLNFPGGRSTVVWRDATPSQELCARNSRIVLSGVHEFHRVLIKGFVRYGVYP